MSSSGNSKAKNEQRKLGIWILIVCLVIVVVAAVMAVAVNGIYTDAVDPTPEVEQPVTPPR